MDILCLLSVAIGYISLQKRHEKDVEKKGHNWQDIKVRSPGDEYLGCNDDN